MGNTARALVKFGYVDHPTVRSAFQWLIDNQEENGGALRMKKGGSMRVGA